MTSLKALREHGELLPLSVLTTDDGRHFHGVVIGEMVIVESAYFSDLTAAQAALDARSEGQTAYEDGIPLEANPYASSPTLSAFWEMGWWGTWPETKV